MLYWSSPEPLLKSPAWVVSQAAVKASPKCGGGGRCSGIEKHDLPEDGRGEDNIHGLDANGRHIRVNDKLEIEGLVVGHLDRGGLEFWNTSSRSVAVRPEDSVSGLVESGRWYPGQIDGWQDSISGTLYRVRGKW